MIGDLTQFIVTNLIQMCDQDVTVEKETPLAQMGTLKGGILPYETLDALADESQILGFGHTALWWHHLWHPRTPHLWLSVKLELAMTEGAYAFNLSLDRVCRLDAAQKMTPLPLSEWRAHGVGEVADG